MPNGGFPNFADQPGLTLYAFKIDGSEVTTSLSAAGLDVRGQSLGWIKDDGANVQTMTFHRAFDDIPYVVIQPLTANGAANISVTASGIVLTGVERDDNTQTLANQDFNVFVFGFNTTQAFGFVGS
jgi:N-acetylglucosamine kinase-like BadF-type ATPase